MATAKFKISDLTDNISSDQLLADPGNYDIIINDISGASAETKKIGLDTLKAGILGSPTSPDGDILINGNVGINIPSGQALTADFQLYGNARIDATSDNPETTGGLLAKEFFVNVAGYTSPPNPGQGGPNPGDPNTVFVPGYSFAASASGGLSDPEGAQDTGMFWDGDDRVFINARNKLGVVVAGRAKPRADQGIRGDDFGDSSRDDYTAADELGARVGVNVQNPDATFHVRGNVKVEEFSDEDGNADDQTGGILAKEYFVDVSSYTEAPNPGDGLVAPFTIVPGYSFASNPRGGNNGTGGEPGNDTGMFWDGDDRFYLIARNHKGLVCAARERADAGSTSGDLLMPGDGSDNPPVSDTHIGINADNPRERLHLKGNLRIDNEPDRTNTGREAHTGIIMQNAAGAYFLVRVNDAGNGFDFTALTGDDLPESPDVA